MSGFGDQGGRQHCPDEITALGRADAPQWGAACLQALLSTRAHRAASYTLMRWFQQHGPCDHVGVMLQLHFLEDHNLVRLTFPAPLDMDCCIAELTPHGADVARGHTQMPGRAVGVRGEAPRDMAGGPGCALSGSDRTLLDNFHAAPPQVQAGIMATLGAFAPASNKAVTKRPPKAG